MDEEANIPQESSAEEIGGDIQVNPEVQEQSPDYDESANVRESKHARAANLGDAYDVSMLRGGQSVADLGRDCMGLQYVFGYDLSRRGNLFFIEENRVIYASSAAVVLENLITGMREFVMGIDAGGVGAVAVHPTRDYFAVGGKGLNPNVYIYSYPDLKVSY